jgi:hypothetical protein
MPIKRSRGRSGISALGRGVPAGAGALGLDHRPQRADRTRWATANAAEVRRHAAELVDFSPRCLYASDTKLIMGLGFGVSVICRGVNT